MSQAVRHQLRIGIAAATVFFTNLGATALWDEDEPLYACCAREMLQRGDWVVPTYNGTMFPEKPPLMFWLMIVGYRILGVTELAARLPSAIFGVLTALVTYRIGRILVNPRAGFWAGIIMASTLIFTVSARAATVDSALVFLTATAFWLFVRFAPAFRRQADVDDGSAQGGRLPCCSGDGAPDPRAAGATATPGGVLAAGIVPDRWLVFVAMYLCLGLAVLAKGPVGVVLPVAVLGLFTAVAQYALARRCERDCSAAQPAEAGVKHGGDSRGLPTAWTKRVGDAARALAGCLSPRNLWKAAWRLRPLTALAIVVAVALPWYVMVGMRTEGEFLAKFLGEQNLQRMFKPMQGHQGPFWYYVPAVFIGFFPWSVFLGLALLKLARRIRREGFAPAEALLACWIGVFFVFWSIVTTKLPHYVLPIYPALAIVTADFLDAWLAAPSVFGQWWLRSGAATLIVVGLGIIVGIAVAAPYVLPGEEAIGLVGLTLVAGGALMYWWTRRQRWAWILPTFGATSVVFLTSMFGLAALRVDRHQNAKPLLAAVRAELRDDATSSGRSPRGENSSIRPVVEAESPGDLSAARLAAYRFLRESTVFYAGCQVEYCDRIESLRRAVDEGEQQADKPLYLFTHAVFLPEIEQALPGRFRVVARQREFLRKGEVVVLASRRLDTSGTAARMTAGQRR